jgi:hypothetical protein
MERRKEGNGWETIFEHWGVAVVFLIAVVLAQALLLFINWLQGL